MASESSGEIVVQPSGHLLGPGMKPWGQSRGFQEYGHSQPMELSRAISCGDLEESSNILKTAGAGVVISGG